MTEEETGFINTEKQAIKREMLDRIERIAQETEEKLLLSDFTVGEADVAVVETLTAALSIHVAPLVDQNRISINDVKAMTDKIIDVTCSAYPEGGFGKKH